MQRRRGPDRSAGTRLYTWLVAGRSYTTEAVVLRTLAREPFLAAVTGNQLSEEALRRLVAARTPSALAESAARHPAGQRLPKSGNGIQAPAAGGCRDDAEAGAAAAVAVGHGRRGEFMLRQDRCDTVVKVRGVVEVFDVGAVDAEDVLHSGRRQIADDMVDNSSADSTILCHSVTCFRTCK